MAIKKIIGWLDDLLPPLPTQHPFEDHYDEMIDMDTEVDSCLDFYPREPERMSGLISPSNHQ